MKKLLLTLAFGYLATASATEATPPGSETSKNHINKADGATVGAEEANPTKKAMHKKKHSAHARDTKSGNQNAAGPQAPNREGSGDPKDDSANK